MNDPVPIKFVEAARFFETQNQRTDPEGHLYISGLEPGSAAWISDTLEFVCPCGCGKVGACNTGLGGWINSGTREAPTLSPSILLVGGCRWHGYLKAGKFERC